MIDHVNGWSESHRGSVTDATIGELAACSRGHEGRSMISIETRCWLGALAAQFPETFWIHRDRASRVLTVGGGIGYRYRDLAGGRPAAER
jgi:hypothetical protein